jgi:hypothetical protein
MDLDDWHLVFVSVCLIIMLAASAPVVVAFLPSQDEHFFALAVLGEEGMAEHYYPDDDPNIEVGEDVHWTIYLLNHMGEIQYIALKVKLLNSTMIAPNSTSFTPSSALVVCEVKRVMLNNETWFFPFSWTISDVVQHGDLIDIRSLSVNGEAVDPHSSALLGSDYRVVIELWVYNENLKEFRFGWVDGNEMRCAWNQIWFNLNYIEAS